MVNSWIPFLHLNKFYNYWWSYNQIFVLRGKESLDALKTWHESSIQITLTLIDTYPHFFIYSSIVIFAYWHILQTFCLSGHTLYLIKHIGQSNRHSIELFFLPGIFRSKNSCNTYIYPIWSNPTTIHFLQIIKLKYPNLFKKAWYVSCRFYMSSWLYLIKIFRLQIAPQHFCIWPNLF